MNKALKLIEELIKEHEENNYCIDEDHIELCLKNNDIESALNCQYDIARYETLKNLYNELKRLEK